MKGKDLLQDWQRVLGLVAIFLLLGTFSSFGAVTDVKVMVGDTQYGGDGGLSFPAPFTPDNDGSADFLNFVFTGSGHDYMVVVDTNGNSQPDQVTDWGNAAGKDWTWMGDADAEVYVQWDGRCVGDPPTVVPNGDYQVWIYENQGDIDNPDWQVVDSSIKVSISTKYITGTVTDGTNPIEGVRVSAGGPDGWGEAVSDSDGHYEIYGLKEGTYHIDAQKDGYFFDPGPNADIQLTGNSASFDITMEEAVTVQLNVTLPEAFNPTQQQDGNLWLNVDAHCTNGPGWAHGNGQIADEASTGSLTLNMESLGANDTWSVRVTGDYHYWDDSQSRDVSLSYTGNATFTLADVDSDSDGTPDTPVEIQMTKAVSVSGTVILPQAATQPLNINVRLQNTTDPNIEAWGWGNIDPGGSSGDFYIPSVASGTYICFIQVDGYRTLTLEGIIVTNTDVDLDTLFDDDARTIDAGLSISGTLHVAGTVDNDSIVWLDAFSPDDPIWHGTSIDIPAGTDQDIDFSISGLDAQDYELHIWMSGYEFTVNGENPWENRIPAGTDDVQLALTPYSGSIKGTITWPSGVDYNGVDYNKVVVAVKGLWGDDCDMTYANPGADGSYQVSGLGTGEYVVVVNELSGDPPVPTGNVAMYSDVVYVENGKPTTLNINLEQPYTVSGSVVDSDGLLSGHEVYAVAMPMEFAMGGGDEFSSSMIRAPVNNDDNHSFTLKLGSGTYLITLQSDDIDFACERKVKVVNSDTEVSLNVSEGHTAYLTLIFPAPVEADQNNPKFLGGLELFKGEQPLATRYEVIVEPSSSNWQPTGDMDAVVVSDGDTSVSIPIENLLDGEYMARFFSPEYIMGKAKFTVAGADVSAQMDLKTGATITGKVVDADTGEVLSTNVTVQCEAIPYVEGSFKSTEWDPNGSFDNTGKFSLRNLPDGTYILEVSYESSSSSSLNYASTSVYGIIISDSSQTVDVGSIKLKKGTTISGQITDASGNPLANIPVEAEPMDTKYGSVLCETRTDPDGYYTITGIDPDIPYWEVDAATRPDAFEKMQRPCGYGEKWKLNIAPGATNVNFELTEATASLSGTITKPENSPDFAPPFDDMEMDIPAAYIVLQRKGVTYSDPMDGIEAMSDPSEGDSTTYTIGNLVPGTYRMMVLSNGLCTYVNNDVEISEGSNTLDISLSQGASVSGAVTKPDGTHPTTTDIEEIVAMNASQELVFGTFTKDPATNEILSYEIKGLKAGVEYHVALVAPGEDGPGDIYVQSNTITPQSANDSLTLNAMMAESAPTFMMKAVKSGGAVNVSIFSTSHLMDASADDMIAVTTGNGTVSNKVLSPDKMMISFTYTPVQGETTFAFTLTAHYGTDYTQVQRNYTIDLTVDGANQGLVNGFTGGKVYLGGGDASGVYFEPGSIEDGDGNGKTVVDVNKTEVGASSEGIRVPSGLSSVVITPEATDALPSWATAVSAQYDFNIGADKIANGNSVRVTLQYNPDAVSDITKLNVLHYTGGTWQIEDTNREVDEENHTISVDVSSLSPFVAAEGESVSSGTDTSASTALAASGGGGGGSCFIETACSETGAFYGMMVFLILIPGLLVLRRK